MAKRPTSTAGKPEAGSTETPPTAAEKAAAEKAAAEKAAAEKAAAEKAAAEKAAAEKAAQPELRAFEVVSHVDHDGTHFEPGGDPIVLDRDTHARLRRGLSIDVDWEGGEPA